MVKNKQGDKFQILPNEVYHREDGTAIVYLDGDKEWWLDIKLHREDVPALEQKNDKNWFLNDVEYTESEHKSEVRKRKLEKLLI